MELQQSALYSKYIAALNWQIITVDGVRMFYKKIPLLGGLLKIQRPQRLPDIASLAIPIKTVAIEPIKNQNLRAYKNWCKKIPFRVVRSDYMPTKTILVDLTAPVDSIFRRFTEAKRRAVRRAKKLGVTVTESSDITALIRIKNVSSGLLGFITTIGIDRFWKFFYPRHATIILAHHDGKLVGGVLLVFWNKTAFYWIAAGTRTGKKMFAPTLLVWEALIVAKKRGAKRFDFLGVWDERKPKDHHDWKGFTKFKEGFGGTALYYPIY